MKTLNGTEEFTSELSYVVLEGGFSSLPLGFSHRAYHNMTSFRTNDERMREREKREREKPNRGSIYHYFCHNLAIHSNLSKTWREITQGSGFQEEAGITGVHIRSWLS